jgi:hypothetical protein
LKFEGTGQPVDGGSGHRIGHSRPFLVEKRPVRWKRFSAIGLSAMRRSENTSWRHQVFQNGSPCTSLYAHIRLT